MKTGERRQDERYPIMMDAMASLDHGRYTVAIFDLSAGGAKIQVRGGFREILSVVDIDHRPTVQSGVRSNNTAAL